MQREKLQEWLLNPVTALQKEVLRERILEALENLANNNEREFDVFVKGMVHAYREILEWVPQIEEDDDDVQSRDVSTEVDSKTSH